MYQQIFFRCVSPRVQAFDPPSGIHIRVSVCVCVHQYIYIYISVWVCVSAKCHIDRLIAVVSDSVTLWLVDSSLIHTPSWVIGPAHWFPACQPRQEELRGRKRACCYWLAPDQPHHLLPSHTHTPNPAAILWHAGSPYLQIVSFHISMALRLPLIHLLSLS